MTGGRPTGLVGRFFFGARHLGGALSFVSAHRSLWPWVLAPTVLALAIAGGGALAGYRVAAALLTAHGHHSAVVGWLLSALVVVLALAAGWVAYLAGCLVAAAPFSDGISERTERLVTGREPPPFSAANLLRGIVHALLGAAIYLSLAGTLLVLHFVVPALAPLASVAAFVGTSVFLAYDHFDYPLQRRGRSFGDKWRFVAAHAAESLGFGAAASLVLLVPGLGLAVPPLCAVGATRLYLALEPD
jgi:uncharacterized protein involved in cysteine biosynthesis